jgi:hypothetical protein
MAQGGASGSPVFDVQTGEVIGAVHSRMLEPHLGKAIPTNFTFALPAHYIQNGLGEAKKSIPVEGPTISDLIAEGEAVNRVTGETVKSIKLPWLT